jgi:hypothetical protein
MTGSATQIADEPFPAHQFGVLIEDVAVERFVIQFVIESPDIFVSNAIITALEVKVHIQGCD